MKNSFNPKTRNELAVAYGISRKTLYRWLKKLEIEERFMLKEDCLNRLYAKYGNPYNKIKIIAK